MAQDIPEHLKARAFIVYSRTDEEHRDVLLQILRIVQVDASITQIADTYFDTKTPVGVQWEGWIREQVCAANLIILLTSEEFDRSPYVTQTELPLVRALVKSGRATALIVRINGHTSNQPLPEGRTVDLESKDLRCQCKYSYYEAFERNDSPDRGGMPISKYHCLFGEQAGILIHYRFAPMLAGVINGILAWLLQRWIYPNGANGFKEAWLLAALVCASGVTVAMTFRTVFAYRFSGGRVGFRDSVPIAIIMMLGVTLLPAALNATILAAIVWLIFRKMGAISAVTIGFLLGYVHVENIAKRFQGKRLPIYWDLVKCKLRPEGGWEIDR